MIDKLQAATLNWRLAKALEFRCVSVVRTRIWGTTGDLFQLEFVIEQPSLDYQRFGLGPLR